MVALPNIYETASLPSSGSKSLIENGQYKAVIVASEWKDIRTAGGKMLVISVILTEGRFANTEFTERLNIINANEQTVKIAYQTLARISEAVGFTSTPADSEALHNKPFMVDIATKQGDVMLDTEGKAKYEGTVPKRYSDYSEIKKYSPLITGGTNPFAVAAAPAPAAPSFGWSS